MNYKKLETFLNNYNINISLTETCHELESMKEEEIAGINKLQWLICTSSKKFAFVS